MLSRVGRPFKGIMIRLVCFDPYLFRLDHMPNEWALMFETLFYRKNLQTPLSDEEHSEIEIIYQFDCSYNMIGNSQRVVEGMKFKKVDPKLQALPMPETCKLHPSTRPLSEAQGGCTRQRSKPP